MPPAAAPASADESPPRTGPAEALTQGLTEVILASHGLYDPPAPQDALVWPEAAVIAHPAPEPPAPIPTSAEWVALLARAEAARLTQELGMLVETAMVLQQEARRLLREGR
jgi:hypothetical protein